MGAGDEMRVVERPDHGLTIGDVFRIFTKDRGELGRLLEVPQMSSAWKGWAEQQLAKQKGRDAEKAPGCC